MMSGEGYDAIRLEHRLTKMEQGQVALQSQIAQSNISLEAKIDAMLLRMDKANGEVAAHFKSDAEWQTAHDRDLAKRSGFRSGAIWVIGLLAGFVSVTFGSMAYLLFRLVGP